jgi:hypothetical protein
MFGAMNAPPGFAAPLEERGVPFSAHLDPGGPVAQHLPPPRLLEAIKAGGEAWVDVGARRRV